MGVPKRFATEYPERCLQLVAALEGFAKDQDLVGSFALLVAAAVLTIPYERMRANHFLHQKEKDSDLAVALESLKKVSFPDAPFWQGEPPVEWRQSRVVANVDDVDGWKDRNGQHPTTQGSENTIAEHDAAEVVRAIRNALSHGNVVYLNKHGREVPGDRMHYLAFLSRYEEGGNGDQAATYRLLVAPEDEFLRFIKLWALWISQITLDATIHEVTGSGTTRGDQSEVAELGDGNRSS